MISLDPVNCHNWFFDLCFARSDSEVLANLRGFRWCDFLMCSLAWRYRLAVAIVHSEGHLQRGTLGDFMGARDDVGSERPVWPDVRPY